MTSNEASEQKDPAWKIAKRVAVAVVILAFVSMISGAAYQVVGTWSDAERFPQRGQSIQLTSVRLNIDCYGDRNSQGSPTVILESGIGGPALGWSAVQSEVAKFARVCSYDRAVYGWSDPGPEPRSSLQIAKELKALLDAADEKGPYVLVGHSFGGFNVRVFTQLYPADVLGVVLVDAAHEDEEKRIDELLPSAVVQQETRDDEWNARISKVLTPLRIYLGIQRLQVATGWGTPLYGVVQAARNSPKELRQELEYLRQQDKFQNAVDAEVKDFAESIAQVRASGTLGDRPLIVLTAGHPYDPDPLLTPDQMAKQNDLWINDLQAQEAHLSTRGKQIVVPDSDHMIPFERPDAVIEAIHEVYDAVRSK